MSVSWTYMVLQKFTISLRLIQRIVTFPPSFLSSVNRELKAELETKYILYNNHGNIYINR